MLNLLFMSNWLTVLFVGLSGDGLQDLHFSHPIICVLLSILVKLILKYSYVPDVFGVGMIIPLLKGDDCDPTVCDNYRAITISPLSVKFLNYV